jgi:hypothetical protein
VSRYAAPGTVYADVWGDGNYAYLGHYNDNRVEIVDISDPAAPFLAATWDVPAPDTDASTYDVKVWDGLMYVCLERSTANAVAIVDVRDPLSPTLLTLIDLGPSLNGSHNTDLQDGWLYIANTDTPDVIIFDLRSYDPDNPPATLTTPAYQFQIPGSTWVHDITARGGRLYVAAWESLDVYDVSGLGSGPPVLLGRAVGQGVHSVWPTDDGEYVVTCEERMNGPMRLYAITDNGGSITLDQVDAFYLPHNESATAHNPVMVGDFIYTSYMQAGLKIIAIDRVARRFELVASFDTSTEIPPPIPPVWSGNWGVYPFLGDDRVLVSDMQEGLFIVEIETASIILTGSVPYSIPAGLVARIRTNVSMLGPDLDAGTVTLVASVNGGISQSIPMVAVADDFVADLPMVECGSRINWSIQADNLDGTTFTRPVDAPVVTYVTKVVNGLTDILVDDFEIDLGWSVIDHPSLNDGTWERGDPVGTNAQPEGPAGAGTNCFFTGQGLPGGSDHAEDVDGGPTELISPDLDFTGTDGVVSYSYWHYNIEGDDPLIVDVSSDAGNNWVEVTRYDYGSGSWLQDDFLVSDFVVPSGQVRLRFSIADSPSNTLTEAAVDDVAVRGFECTWENLGFAFAGTYGDAVLAGTGTLLAGDPLTIGLTNALEFTSAYLVVGLSAAHFPYQGGVMVPDVIPPGFFVGLFTNGAGELLIPATWPTGIPSGFELYMQYWLIDPVGMFGWSASNAVRARAP